MFPYPSTVVPIRDGPAAGYHVVVEMELDGHPQREALVAVQDDGQALALRSDPLVVPPGHWVTYSAQRAPGGGWEYVVARDRPQS